VPLGEKSYSWLVLKHTIYPGRKRTVQITMLGLKVPTGGKQTIETIDKQLQVSVESVT